MRIQNTSLVYSLMSLTLFVDWCVLKWKSTAMNNVIELALILMSVQRVVYIGQTKAKGPR